MDFLFKAGKRAVDRGQNYDNWLNGAGRKIFLSRSARAASRGMVPEPNHQLVAPVAQPGDPSTVRVGDIFSNSVSQPGSSQGGAASYPLSLSRRGDPTSDLSGGVSGSGVPQTIQALSVPDQLACILSNVKLMECLGKFKNFQ